MRSQENNASSQNDIQVKISRLGNPTIELTVPKDSTVDYVLENAHIALEENEQTFVAGVEAQGSDILDDNDVLTIVTPKQAG